MSKNDQNFDRFQDPWDCIFGPDRRNARASWRDYREVLKLRQRRFAVRCRDLLLRSWHLWQLQQLRFADLTRRDLAPAGRAADCLPQGGTPPPARPFYTAPRVSRVLSLSISATSATLICTIVFGIVFFSSLLGRSWRLLSPLDRLLRFLGLLFGPPGALLAASWSLLGRSGGGLGASWALLGRSLGGLGTS